MSAKSQKIFSLSSQLPVTSHYEQSKSLQQQITKLKKCLRGQHHYFLNQTVNHDLYIQKMITKLTLTRFEIQSLKEVKDAKQLLDIAIDFCLKQFVCLMECDERLKNHWNEILPFMQEKQINKKCVECENCICKNEQNDNQNYEDVGFSEENCAKLASIQYLEEEVQELEVKYEEILKENTKIRDECFSLTVLSNEYSNKLKEANGQIDYLKAKNTELVHQLRQSKEISSKTMQAWIIKYRTIERQNQRLYQLQKKAFKNEVSMNKIIEQNESQLQKFYEQVHRLQLEVQSFQIKFMQILENDTKAKYLDDLRYKRYDQRTVLCEIPTQNTIDTVQSIASKKELEKIRKFNIQAFQQKLSSFNVVA